MLKRILIVASLTLALVLALEPLQSVHGIVMTDVELAMLNAPAPPLTPAVPDLGMQNHGNAFVRALKAPFKAIGRLFGRGRKDDNSLHRLSEKDVKKFEAAGVTRVVDARSVPVTDTDAAASTTPAETVAEALDARKAEALVELDRGRQLLNGGNVNEAIGALSLATSYDPDLKEADSLLGVAYGIKGLRNLAVDSFKRSLAGDHDSPEHLNNLGYFLYQNGEYADAVKYLKKAVKLAPTNQRFWNNLGLAQAQRGKFDDAYESFARALGEFEGRLNIAVRLARLGQDKEAIKHLEKACALRPTSQEALSRLIAVYERNGRNEQALQARMSLVALRATAQAPTK
jgi:Flp pilus assembly protein TadD